MAKSNKILLIILCAIAFVFCIVFASCTHVHVFKEWKSDDEGHWQVCSCGEKMGEKKSHNVTSWVVDLEATESTSGLRHGKCAVCQKEITETIPALNHVHVYSLWGSDDVSHWKKCDCGVRDENSVENHTLKWIVDTPATATAPGVGHDECEVCKKQFASKDIPPIATTTKTVDFYAINDFHGATNRMSQVAGYMKGRKNENANTVLINSGDMFQGSMESNSNYGKLLSNCMDATGFDSFTFGNHEFDWGLDNLRELASNSAVPFLGANIYNWNAQTKEFGEFASDLAQEYVIKTLDNGLKIGIIGVIGKTQITSISSNLVQTIGFKDPEPIIKTLSTKLRNEEGCDVIVVSAHASSSQIDGEQLGGYVDAVFCAHSHEVELGSYSNGVPYIQGGSYGYNVSHIQLSVDSTGKVTCVNKENIPFSYNWDNLYVVDQLIDNSNAAIQEEANEVLGYLTNTFSSSPTLPRLVCRAIAEYAISQGHDDISLAMTNNARSPLQAGSITYTKLYQALPFDNVVYVAKVKGEDILHEAGYSSNSIWRVDGAAIESDKYYKIAVIDYLLFHQNSSRNYDYFPSAFTSGFEPVPLTHNDYMIYNYRFITRDYLRNNNINEDDYTITGNSNDTSLLGQTVSLSTSYSEATVVNEITADSPYTIAEATLFESGTLQERSTEFRNRQYSYITSDTFASFNCVKETPDCNWISKSCENHVESNRQYIN